MKKAVSFLLSVVLLLSLVPVLPATQAEAASEASQALTTLSKENSTIAPGIRQEIGTVRKKFNNEHLVYYQMTIDLSNEYAHIYANYKDNEWEPHMKGQYGFQDVTDQMAAAQRNHSVPGTDRYIPNYTVVGGVNGTGFDMSTGQTRGILVMEHHIVQEAGVNGGKNEPFFGIDEDGKAHIYWNEDGKDWENNKGKLKEAINSFVTPLIKDGKIVCSTSQSDENARTALGIKKNGEVVLLVTDGKQKPTSAGCAMYELALLLKEAGCVDAFNMDGGGSTTYVARPAGESDYRILSKPCDGSPRSVSASLVVVSTAPAANTFGHAALTTKSPYIAPGGTAQLNAVGLSPMEQAFAIPEGAEWYVDPSFGTVTQGTSTDNNMTQQATFTAAEGFTGEATISLMVDGQSAGDVTVNVVQPTKIEFELDSYAVPYGESIDLKVIATYETANESRELAVKDGTIAVTIDNEQAGIVTGFKFAACDGTAEDAPTSANFTATYTSGDVSLTDTATLTLGKGSQVLFDFEPGYDAYGDYWEATAHLTSNGIQGSRHSRYYGIEHFTAVSTTDPAKVKDTDTKPMTEEGCRDVILGKVHSGDYALAVNIDASNVYQEMMGTGVEAQLFLRFEFTGKTLNWQRKPTSGKLAKHIYTGARGIGSWVWVPDDGNYISLRQNAPSTASADTLYGNMAAVDGGELQTGSWVYVYISLASLAGNNSERSFMASGDGQALDFMDIFLYGSKGDLVYNMNDKMTFYVDDVTIDWSPVVPDRIAPKFGGEVSLRYNSGEGDLKLVKGTTPDASSTTGEVFFQIENVTDPEPVEYSTTSGIDPASARAYLDGVEIPGTVFAGSTLTTGRIKPTPGVHTVYIELADKTGNLSHVVRTFNFKDNADASTLRLVPATTNPNTGNKQPETKIPMGSVYYYDLVASDIETIDKVELTVDLDNISSWELEQITAHPSFTVKAEMTDAVENVATITISREKEVYDTGECVLAKIPLRAFMPTILVKDGSQLGWGNKGLDDSAYSMQGVWNSGKFAPVAIKAEIDKGLITYVNGTESDVLPTFGGSVLTVTERYNGGTTVKAENQDKHGWHEHDETVAIDNKDATCLEAGYTGRKICKDCGSPVSAEDWGVTVPAKGHTFELNGEGKMACKDCGTLLNGTYEGKLYKEGVSVKGWQKDTYYNDGVLLQGGIYQTTDTVGEEAVERWHLFDADGKCADKDAGYTGYYAADEKGVFQPVQKLPVTKEEFAKKTYYYAELGLPKSDWVTGPTDDLTQPSYHTGADGKVHWVEVEDTRECVKSGYLNYSCTVCKDPEDETKPLTKQSELLWWNGHIWDENYECTKCHYHGRDIGKAILNIAGELFDYTGNEIRAAHIVSDNGQWLSVRSDKNGLDGYSSYANNKEIGTATLTIKGQGNYYGELTGTFKIVPQSVTTITATETAEGEDSSSLTFTWAPAKGAGYYELYRLNEQTNLWVSVARVDAPTTTCTVTGLKMGESYQFKLASRTVGADGKTYYCSTWSNIISGTIEHIWEVDQEQSTDATCTEPGLTVRHCTVPGCGATEKIETDPLGHKVENWETTVEPTYSSAGSRTGECTVCGETVTEEIPRLQYTGTGNSTAPGTTQETVTNPDGSTTTTTTKPDGSTTETTEMVDGTVTEKNTDADGVVTETTTKPDNTVTEKVTQTDGSATERTTTPDGVVGQTNTDAEGEVTSAEVVIPKSAEKQDVVTAPVEVPASQSTEDAPEINVKVGFGESAKVEIPVTEFGPGTVAVVVNPDGTEEIVRDCVIGENGVVLNVEGDVTLKIVDKTETFEDVEPAHHWASDAVEFVAARELFKGTGANKFTPNGAMTRGMMVTVLYRLAYEPDTVAEQFEDVPSGQYYTDAVAWAQSAGVVTGYTDSEFGPNDNVKREQLVTILYRYAKKMGYVTTASGTLAGYADASSVSGWAKDAMSWAVELGLVNGVDKTHLAPANNATRAEVATILMRFCEKVVK